MWQKNVLRFVKINIAAALSMQKKYVKNFDVFFVSILLVAMGYQFMSVCLRNALAAPLLNSNLIFTHL
jgi:hypothetical protein